MKRFIKKHTPKFILRPFLSLLTYCWIKTNPHHFSPLIIRPGTSDSLVYRSVFIIKELEIPIHIKPRLIVDIGAYTGLSALFFHHQYPDAEIIAVEPEASNFSILERHTSHIQSIKRVNSAVWSTTTNLRFVDVNLGKWGTMVEEVPPGKPFDIKATTISDILALSAYPKIDILKIDIEGSEVALFRGNTDWISKVDVMIVELHDRMVPGCSDALYSALDLNEWNEFREEEKLIFIRKDNSLS